ncbi:MAG: 2'-5' RNA ligase family protein [Anaerolineales bacterium]|nr:2'-5' RNA ligase family protein [Anaerolineales bacterium]
MKATFALLANPDVHNLVRKLSWQIHTQYRTGTSVCRLPPHISLKQPFEVTDLPALEDYLRDLAGSLDPFDVTLTELQLIPAVFEGRQVGLVWLEVQESKELRQLHQRVNLELSQRFQNTQAAHDGAEYHFHMTVMMGGQPPEVYRQFFGETTERTLNLRFTVRELAMFVYDEPLSLEGDFMTYRILQVGRQGNC